MQLKRVSWTEWGWIVIIISLFTVVFCSSDLSYLIKILINYSPFPLLGRLKFCLLNPTTKMLLSIPVFGVYKMGFLCIWCVIVTCLKWDAVVDKLVLRIGYSYMYQTSLAEEVQSVHKIFLPFVYSVRVCPYCFASYCHIQNFCYKKILVIIIPSVLLCSFLLTFQVMLKLLRAMQCCE
jgi:hypothetical protein